MVQWYSKNAIFIHCFSMKNLRVLHWYQVKLKHSPWTTFPHKTLLQDWVGKLTLLIQEALSSLKKAPNHTGELYYLPFSWSFFIIIDSNSEERAYCSWGLTLPHAKTKAEMEAAQKEFEGSCCIWAFNCPPTFWVFLPLIGMHLCTLCKVLSYMVDMPLEQ